LESPWPTCSAIPTASSIANSQHAFDHICHRARDKGQGVLPSNGELARHGKSRGSQGSIEEHSSAARRQRLCDNLPRHGEKA
jgi:hypothetical protein